MTGPLNLPYGIRSPGKSRLIIGAFASCLFWRFASQHEVSKGFKRTAIGCFGFDGRSF
jgi:hypothetical protein